MICKNCNHEIPQGAMFCTNCGTPVAEPEARNVSAPQAEEKIPEAQPAAQVQQPAAEAAAGYDRSAAQPQQPNYGGQKPVSEQNPYVNPQNTAPNYNNYNYGGAQGMPAQPAGSPYVSHYGEPINNGANARYNEQYRQTYNAQPPRTPAAPAVPPVTPYNSGSGHVGVGAWIGVMLLNCIPLVNIIMLFVWAFGSTAKPSLKNYARASLIMWAIALVLFIILAVICLAAGVTISQIFSSSGYSYYYY